MIAKRDNNEGATRPGGNKERSLRGSVYVMVLASAALVTAIGLSGLLAARVQHRQFQYTGDFTKARFYALSGIDSGFLIIERNPHGWRGMLWQMSQMSFVQPIGDGTFELRAAFTSDGDGDWTDDSIALIGIGHCRQARYKLQVQLDANGAPVPGTWRQLTD